MGSKCANFSLSKLLQAPDCNYLGTHALSTSGNKDIAEASSGKHRNMPGV